MRAEDTNNLLHAVRSAPVFTRAGMANCDHSCTLLVQLYFWRPRLHPRKHTNALCARMRPHTCMQLCQ